MDQQQTRITKPWHRGISVPIGGGYALAFSPLGTPVLQKASESLPDIPTAQLHQRAVMVREELINSLALIHLWLRQVDSDARSSLVAPPRGGLAL